MRPNQISPWIPIEVSLRWLSPATNLNSQNWSQRESLPGGESRGFFSSWTLLFMATMSTAPPIDSRLSPSSSLVIAGADFFRVVSLSPWRTRRERRSRSDCFLMLYPVPLNVIFTSPLFHGIITCWKGGICVFQGGAKKGVKLTQPLSFTGNWAVAPFYSINSCIWISRHFIIV